MDARVVKSRRALLDAGIELLLQNPTATLSQIAAHAKVGRATLYRHFETREQLIQALAKESLALTDEAMQPVALLQGRAALLAMLEHMMPLADRYHFLLGLWNIAAEDAEVMAIYNRQLAQLAQWVEQGKADGSINEALSTSWVVASIDSLIYTAWWMMGNEGMTPEQAARQAQLSLFQGIDA